MRKFFKLRKFTMHCVDSTALINTRAFLSHPVLLLLLLVCHTSMVSRTANSQSRPGCTTIVKLSCLCLCQ